MGTGVDPAVLGKVMRKVNVRTRIAKSELQDLHSWNSQPLAQRTDFRSDDPQVFGQQRKVAETGAQNMKELVLGALAPMALDGGGFGGRDFPVTLKPAKVAQPTEAAILQGPEKPLHPPIEHAAPACVPTIQRIAPTLSG